MPEILAMPRRSYSYRRVSDPQQGKAGKHGLHRQEDFAKQLSDEEGWILDDTLVFVDKGKSGFHGHNLRPTAALAQFLDAVKTGRIVSGSVLIIENIDRLSRQEVDVAYDLFRGLIKAGLWIATQMPRRIYRRENNSFLDLMEPLWLMYLAYMESLKKSERVAAEWKKRRKDARSEGKPIGRLCPRWLRLGDEGYELIPGREATLKKIFSLATKDGMGVARICRWLNDNLEQYPSFGRGRTWLRSYIRDILRDRTTLGEYQPRTGPKMLPDGEPIQGFYPAVVTEDDWHLAQAAIEGRRRKCGRPGEREANLFTGFVYEATTRKVMCVTNGGRRLGGKSYRYLLVNQLGQTCRTGKGMPYEQFEDGIKRAINLLDTADVMPPDATITEREARIDELTKKVYALDVGGKQIQRQIEDPANALIVADLTKSLLTVRTEHAEVKSELERLKWDSMTGRGESLATAKSLIELEDKVRGTPEHGLLRLRLKASLRWLVEEIWLVVQPIARSLFIGHAQIYLRSGKRRYVRIMPPRCPSCVKPWLLGRCDLRAGEIGDITLKLKPGA